MNSNKNDLIVNDKNLSLKVNDKSEDKSEISINRSIKKLEKMEIRKIIKDEQIQKLININKE